MSSGAIISESRRYEDRVYARSGIFGQYGTTSPLLDLIADFSREQHDVDWIKVQQMVEDAAALGLDVSDPDIAAKILARAVERAAETADRQARWAARDELLTDQALVYYLMMPGDVVKIGTTVNLKSRLVSLRVDTEAVRATEPGSYDLERMRHQQFRHLRVGRREDFRPEPDLLSHIAMLVKHFGQPTLTTWVKLPPSARIA